MASIEHTPTSSGDKLCEEIRIISAAEAAVPNGDICAFYEKHWARPIALAREDFSFWQFNEAPTTKGKNNSIVALDGDQVIAVMGVTPTPFNFNGRSMQGAELTTWVVAPEARGKGVGRKILAELQQRYEVLAGAGISEAAIPLYLSAGFTYLAHMPRFFYVSNFEKIRQFTSASERALRTTAARQENMTSSRTWRAKPVAAAELADNKGTLSALGHFNRDAERLAWRYDRHPAFEYEAFFVQDTDRLGIGAGVILRADNIDGAQILQVVDLFGDPKDMPAALAFCEAEARNRDAAFIDVSLTSGSILAHLRSRHWSSAVDDPLIELPSLFYPVELRRPPTTSIAMWGRHEQEALFNLSRVHLTRGDLDLDRPTLAWYKRHSL